MFSDLYLEDLDVLVEAKGTETRESVRTAIGQLYDYRRYEPVEDILLAVLLPGKARPELQELVSGLGIATVWQDSERFDLRRTSKNI